MPKRKLNGLYKSVASNIQKEQCIKSHIDTVTANCSQTTIAQSYIELKPDEYDTSMVAKFGLQALHWIAALSNSVPKYWPDVLREKLILELCGREKDKILTSSDLELLLKSVNRLQSPDTQNSADLSYIGPPQGECSFCEKKLTENNLPTRVKYVTPQGKTAYKLKLTLRCVSCNINYGFDKFGNTTSGYAFYATQRDAVCATDTILVDRHVYNLQWSLAQHSWVSFMGFSEAWHDAHNISPQDGIDRRMWAECFWWGEIEQEIRESGDLSVTFMKDLDREMLMVTYEEKRKKSVYEHPEKDCTADCKARGCGKLWVTDGIWKLQFPHCMFHVQNIVENMSLLNYPEVCTNSPAFRQAFCAYHCKTLREHNPPRKTALADIDDTHVNQDTDDQKSELELAVVIADHSYASPAILGLGHKLIDDHPAAIHDITKNCGKVQNRCQKDLGERKTLRKMSRGHQFVVRAGGHIDTWTPLYQSESPGQVFLFLISWLYITLRNIPVNSWNKLFLAYDNMCHLVKLKAAQCDLPLPPPYNLMWKSINKVIDTLHIANHIEKTCQTDLHPDRIGEILPELKFTKNTQAGEQTFVWASRFKKIISSMPKTHHLFYLHRMVKRRNAYTARCYQFGRKPVLPGLRNANST